MTTQPEIAKAIEALEVLDTFAREHHDFNQVDHERYTKPIADALTAAQARIDELEARNERMESDLAKALGPLISVPPSQGDIEWAMSVALQCARENPPTVHVSKSYSDEWKDRAIKAEAQLARAVEVMRPLGDAAKHWPKDDPGCLINMYLKFDGPVYGKDTNLSVANVREAAAFIKDHTNG